MSNKQHINTIPLLCFKRSTIHLMLPLCGVLFCASTLANTDKQDVWKSEENGVTIYSDQPSQSSQPITLNSSTRYTPTTQSKPPQSSINTTTDNTKNTAELIENKWKIEFLSPKNEEAIRANNGTIRFIFTLTSTLTGSRFDNGESLRWILDKSPPTTLPTNRVKGQENTFTFTLENLDRGEHSMQLQLLDNSGKVIAQTPLLVFFVLRHHLNAPN